MLRFVTNLQTINHKLRIANFRNDNPVVRGQLKPAQGANEVTRDRNSTAEHEIRLARTSALSMFTMTTIGIAAALSSESVAKTSLGSSKFSRISLSTIGSYDKLKQASRKRFAS